MIVAPAVSPHRHLPARPLSPRSREVLALMVAGFTAREIAAVLGIACETVRGHRAVAYRRLGIHNRTQAARWMLGRGQEEAR